MKHCLDFGDSALLSKFKSFEHWLAVLYSSFMKCGIQIYWTFDESAVYHLLGCRQCHYISSFTPHCMVQQTVNLWCKAEACLCPQVM